MELSFEPLISPTLWVTLAVMAVALLAWYGLRRPAPVRRWRWAAILSLMSGGLGLALLVLLNPTWMEEIAPPAGKPILTVLVDTSASMATCDADGGRTRYAAARETATELVRRLEDRFRIDLRTFDATAVVAQPKDLADREPEGDATDLAGAMAACVDEDRPQGQALVLLSDGIDNAPGGVGRALEAARFAQAMATPIYTRTIGGQATVGDLAVELRSPQQLAYVGQKVPITARVTHRGLPGGRAVVSLTHEGEEVGRHETDLHADGSVDVLLEVSQEERGIYHYEVRVEPMAGEVTQANNRASYVLHVVDEPIRILLLEGKPYWDTKFLMRTLASDPAVALESVVRLTEGRLLRRTLSRARPRSGASGESGASGAEDETRLEDWSVLTNGTDVLSDAEVLNTYQIVVLGRDAEHFLTEVAVANLRNWIARQGGSLVCYRGSPVAQVNEQLGRLLPVRWSPARETRFRMKLTEQGQESHWLAASEDEPEGEDLSRLPTLAAGALPGHPKPLAVVLATTVEEQGGEEKPALTYQPYGLGRTVVVEGAGMWRWAFLPPEHKEAEAAYSALWHSLLRWLVCTDNLLPGRDRTLRADKVTFSTTEPVTATLLMREEAGEGGVPSVELIGEDAEGKQVFTPVAVGDEPGTFRVLFGTLAPGRYRARIVAEGQQDASNTIVFEVRSLAKEQLDLKARPDLMRRVAEEGGGAVIEVDAAGEITRHFDEHLARVRPPRVRRTSAWDRWWALLGIMGVWGAAWGLRRSGGLV